MTYRPWPNFERKMRHRLFERTHSIDVGELNREGAFAGQPMRFPFQGLTTWRFKVEYRGTNWPKERRSQIVSVTWTRCHFGGIRPWFVCSCGKRTARLYPGQFELLACRKCEAVKFPREGAGLLSSLIETDGLVELPESTTQVEPGTTVAFLPKVRRRVTLSRR
jgi:hypothetical protein